MPELAVAMGLAGFVFGLFYFAAVQRTAVLLAARKSWFAPLALTLGRIAAAAIFLTLAAKLGAASLLSAFLGFLLSRAVALRNAGRVG
jgi:NADH:ubiquinone oxidoreductase subunit 6 (subunit J)